MISAQNLQQQLNGNNLIFNLLVLIILYFNSTNVSAQYAEVLKNENGVFYIHTVEEGNTVYGIQRWYGCSVDELLKANSGIERGLVNGTVVYVPVTRKTVQHLVQKGETLFGLSKLYDVSVDSIIVQNPFAENGLKIDQKLTIRRAIPRVEVAETLNEDPKTLTSNTTPLIQLTFTDSVIEHRVLPQETMQSIAKRFMIPVQRILELNQLNSSKLIPGQQIKIPVKKENLSPVLVRTPVKKDPLPSLSSSWGDKLPKSPKIAIFLPLNLDSIPEINKSVSNFALDFYLGAKIALDSLEKSGFSAHVKVIDYHKKGKSMLDIITIENLSSYDLIFAPFDKKEAEILHNWSIGKNIHVVYGTAIAPASVKKNPLALTYSTTNEQLIVGMAKYLRKMPGRVVLIKNEKSEEVWMQNTFISTYRNVSKGNDVPLIEANWKNYNQFEQIGGDIYFVFLSTEKEKVLPLLSQYKEATTYKVVGLKDWADWKEINANVKNKFNFIFAAPNQFEYDENEIKEFHRKFRNSKQADLTKTVCLGYDVIYNVLKYSEEKIPQKGLISNLNPSLRNELDGFENSAAIPVFFEAFKTRNLIK
jgi:LysM repeat protein